MGKKKSMMGVDSLHYALLSSDTSTGATWQAAVAMPGVTEVAVNPNGAVATLFADNGPAITANSIGEIEVSVNMADLTPEERAILLGHTRSGGVTSYKGGDVSPEVAIGFRTKLSDGTYGYVWLMKGRFAEGQETIQTQGGSINFQVAALTGRFSLLEYNDEWKRTTRTDDPDYVAATGTNWFTNGPLGTSDTTPPTVQSVVPADMAVSVAVDSTVVWTFDEAIQASDVTGASFFVIDDADAVVAGSLTINSDHDEVTWTPDSDMANSTEHRAIVTTGVHDLAGNALAAPHVTTFTTTA